MKNFLFTSMLLLFGLIVGLIFAEIMVRIINPQFIPDAREIWKFDKEWGIFLGEPQTTYRHHHPYDDFDVSLTHNRFGLRDTKDLATATGEDLVLVGDSYAYGYGVEVNDRFSNLVEEKLGTRIFNISAPGMDIDNYGRMLEFAKYHGATIRRLIISICMENDLRDYSNQPTKAASKQDRTSETLAWISLGMVEGLLRKYSALHHFTLYWLHNIDFLKRLMHNAGLIDIATAQVSTKALETSAERLGAMAVQFDATILIIPNRLLWVVDNRYDQALKVHKTFINLLKRRNLTVIDPSQAILGLTNPRSVHFPNDGHWNELGHRVAAEYILNELPRF